MTAQICKIDLVKVKRFALKVVFICCFDREVWVKAVICGNEKYFGKEFKTGITQPTMLHDYKQFCQL